jgi:hypothetical protein
MGRGPCVTRLTVYPGVYRYSNTTQPSALADTGMRRRRIV